MWILNFFKVIGITFLILLGLALFVFFLPIMLGIAISVIIGCIVWAAVFLDPVKPDP